MNPVHGLVSNLQGNTSTSKNYLCTYLKSIKGVTIKLLKIICLDYIRMSTIQEQTSTRTKSGRLVKKPERYVPVEKVEDDYATDEHDTDTEEEDEDDDDFEADTATGDVITSDDDDDDEDSEGSLVDFVVPDSDSDSEEEEDESESE